MTKKKGYLALVLHAHLPYVRHPECDYMMEENWLYEAITETYIPLLWTFNNLVEDRIPFRITMSITPTLCSMLSDELLQSRYSRHISKLIELAEKEISRTNNDPEFGSLAEMYLQRFLFCKEIFEKNYGCNLLTGFKRFQDIGVLEIITCGATHGYFPNMQSNPSAVRAQVQTAVNSYNNYFDRPPSGIWLPECGYYPGVEKIISEAGIKYFFTETHGILKAEPKPKYDVFAPVSCVGVPVTAFGRDIESSKSVWSAQEGYPGHPAYREFYRDIGFDLDFDYIKPYIDPVGIRINTGIKYYRITSKDNDKKPYNRNDAIRVASEHAGNFMFNRERQIEYLLSKMERPPIIVAPYDAELFGHWWYEGPEWLNFLIRKSSYEQDWFCLATPSDYLAEYPENQRCKPAFSSWGEGGYSDVWVHESNNWIYRHLHIMEKRMTEYSKTYPESDGLMKRTLNQMARELLLAESSDWAFIMKTGTMVEYAVRRTKEHIANFNRLYEEIKNNEIDESYLLLLESHNNIFPDIDYKVYGL